MDALSSTKTKAVRLNEAMANRATFVELPLQQGVVGGRRLRIAHVQLLPMLSGVQRVSLEEFSQLDPAVYDRTLICREPGPLSDVMEAMGVKCVFCPSLVRSISPKNDLTALAALSLLMRKMRFDIVHTHSSKPGIVGRLAARLVGVPAIVHTVHGFAFPMTASRFRRNLFAALERIAGRCCDLVVCLNDTDREIAETALAIPNDRVHIVPNGVDLSRFPHVSTIERMRIRKEILGISVDEPAIVMVGRLWQQKDPMTLVKAATSLLNDGVKAHFVFVGDGELRSELCEYIRLHGAEERIHLLGWRDDIPQILPAFDIFALSSRWEGMPLAILEAMASRLPCVVTDIPGNRDLIDDGVNGLLVPCGDIESFAASLGNLIYDSEMRVQFGQTARSKVEQCHNLVDRTNEIEKRYLDILSKKLPENVLREFPLMEVPPNQHIGSIPR